ncbi:MAG: NADH-quinone oxidoreductase subunit NuoI [Nitrospirae bacterium]|jgi:NADH-quinone oxidoreductase chain I|nr:NADH-quinone oxidoreductase subunit NuoI [Nitrospirota bacterium]
MTFKKFIKTVTFIEILKGMALTLSRFFSRSVTIQYPDERRPIAPGFRGQHALAKHPQTGEAKCVGCGLCATICPSQCIHVFREKGKVSRYEIEVLRCIYCGFCVEACPYGAVVLTENYEYSDYSKENLYMTKEKLLSNWDKYMPGNKGEEYFKRFWRPMSGDFETPSQQPMFRGKRS